ncbi:MAG: DUF4845 domain-containing protein [Halioglobus sp.]
MITRRRQSGMSLLGTLCVVFMLGFFAMCLIRMFPPYFEYLTVRTIISKIAMDADSTIETNSTIRRKIANVFNSNQIIHLAPIDVKVYRLKVKTYIDANYEVRLPIVWRVDAVLKFDDLLYQVGDPEPLSKPPTVNK